MDRKREGERERRRDGHKNTRIGTAREEGNGDDKEGKRKREREGEIKECDRAAKGDVEEERE